MAMICERFSGNIIASLILFSVRTQLKAEHVFDLVQKLYFFYFFVMLVESLFTYR